MSGYKTALIVIQSILIINAVKFVALRLIKVSEYYDEEREDIQEDRNHCVSCDAKTSGRKYGVLCAEACANGLRNATVRAAVKQVLEDTYWCMDEKCRDIYFDVTGSWRNQVGLLLYILMSPFIISSIAQTLWASSHFFSPRGIVSYISRKGKVKGGPSTLDRTFIEKSDSSHGSEPSPSRFHSVPMDLPDETSVNF